MNVKIKFLIIGFVIGFVGFYSYSFLQAYFGAGHFDRFSEDEIVKRFEEVYGKTSSVFSGNLIEATAIYQTLPEDENQAELIIIKKGLDDPIVVFRCDSPKVPNPIHIVNPDLEFFNHIPCIVGIGPFDQNISEHSMTFSAGNMTFHEELCLKNDGKWVNYQFESKCYFETNTEYELAEIAFTEAGKTIIPEDVAKNVCIILDIPCPEVPKFEAWLDRDEGTATFTYYKNKEQFTFLIEDNEVKYRTDTSRNEWKTFDDNILERFQEEPEVEAFYATYPEALEEVRDDHVSYFAGSEDDYNVRMNMFFDENYELDHMDFHCYFQREHQFEFPEEDIATKIEKYECKKSSSGD